MINLAHPELAELTTPALPRASLDALETLRNQSCAAAGGNFSLQPQQKFLRRVLSPDSPTRNLLMVHGTGVGKTCTAIQIAEEYILRPEFQDKKVMVVASRAVQENFRTQIFDMSRVKVTPAGLESKQCTGRKYLEMLQRIEAEPKNWSDPTIVSRLETISDRIIKEFYEFSGYNSFGERLREKLTGTKADIDEDWVHENFDNRLLIIDEAHNIRAEAGGDSSKAVTEGLERLIKVADGMVLVLLTATPMFHSFTEIVDYMNLFNWNQRTQDFKKVLKWSDFFAEDATLKPERETEFRDWCQNYVSYVKGESPFTFPFRLPPPHVAPPLTKSFTGKSLSPTEQLSSLSLVSSPAAGIQKKTLATSKKEDNESKRSAMMLPTISVLPDNKPFSQTFSKSGSHYAYIGEPCLTPETLPNHAAKFVSVIKSIEASSGISLVYSNYVTQSAELFAMALEEHGYTAYNGKSLMAPKTGSSKGTYILLTSDASNPEISDMLKAVKSRENTTGKKIKVVITSPIASEGVDFRYIRQVHILDPWWNMSRIEQVVGRALRTCSHQALAPEEQNCTVYLHVIRAEENREAYDEFTYRTKVEAKAIKIAKVRKVLAESAMDCPMQYALPADWKELEVPQIRDEEHEQLSPPLTLGQMMAPAFDESPDVESCKVKPSIPDPDHVRPLSSYLDSKDEILTKLGKMFVDKSIWDRQQLFDGLKPHGRDVVVYTLQQAIANGFKFMDAFGRPSLLESKADLYALAPIDEPNRTLIERTRKPSQLKEVALPEAMEVMEEVPLVADDILDTRREAFRFPGNAATRFSTQVKNGYIFDHKLTPPEKKAYLATHPELPFASRITISENLFATGEDMDLIGEEETSYNEYNKQLVEKFIADKSNLVASVAENGSFTLTPMEIKDGIPVRIVGTKSFKPTVCGTGQNPRSKVEVFAKYIDVNKMGVPEDLKGVPFCVYVELLAREEHNVKWYTPEEMRIIESETNKKKIQSAFKGK